MKFDGSGSLADPAHERQVERLVGFDLAEMTGCGTTTGLELA
jgi:hypothetical protein